MSCFVVSNGTMDRVVNAIAYETYRTRVLCAEEMDMIGRELFELNWKAFRTRYADSPHILKDQPTELNPDVDYDCHVAPHKWTAVQRYKAVQCLIYQLSEGEEIEKHPRYIQLEKLKSDLAAEIVQHLPEYESAEWDAAGR